MNTVTDCELGTGGEDPRLFDPDSVDADEWVTALESAGMRGVILTAKHHDGFCLWPSRYTNHTVAASPWRGGRGDLVREVSEACLRHGMRFGVYLSPWDLAKPSYGRGVEYDDFYVGQLVELLTGYGELFTVWLDGAGGEGPDGRRQEHAWDRYYQTVRAFQPEAVISVCGPDVRWSGTEPGYARADEWSVVPQWLQEAEHTPDWLPPVKGRPLAHEIRLDSEDLGSRAALAAAGVEVGDLVWYPAEVNTSIRPGWFHHPAEDDQVHSAAQLFEIYQQAVGGNSTFLLNVPPDRHGRISEPDKAELAELGRLIKDFRGRVVTDVPRVILSSGFADGDGVASLANDAGCWSPDADDPAPWLELCLRAPSWIDGLVLKEQLTCGQRIENVQAYGWDGQHWRLLARAGSVGYQRILRFARFHTDRVRVVVNRFRGPIVLAAACVVAAPPER